LFKPIHARIARAALRWSFVDLEEKTGISKNTLVRFESGGGVNHSTAIKIEQAFAKEGVRFVYESDAHGAGLQLSRELSRRLTGELEKAPAGKSPERSQKSPRK
jgi:transcriptional regulator with XRE-family HTH domain